MSVGYQTSNNLDMLMRIKRFTKLTAKARNVKKPTETADTEVDVKVCYIKSDVRNGGGVGSW